MEHKVLKHTWRCWDTTYRK